MAKFVVLLGHTSFWLTKDFNSVPQDEDFDLLSDISDIETIARGTGVRIRRYLNATYGFGQWRKRKGNAWIRIT